MTRIPILIVAAIIILVGGASFTPAFAQFYQPNLQAQAFSRFHQSDKCVRDATAKFPDHDAATLRLRDSAINDCLDAHHLPPRAPLAPPDDPNPADATGAKRD